MSSAKKGLSLALVRKAIGFVIGSSRIVMRINWREYLRIRRWKVFLAIAVPVVIAVVVVGIEITSTPKFCSSCHNMEPYYDSWQVSSHNEVNCIKCHSDPGLVPYLKTKANGLVEVAVYLSGNIPTNYQTEVSDESCLRKGCHSIEEVKGQKVDFVEGMPFGHEEHLETLNDQFDLRCTSCHAQVVQTEHISVSSATCNSCHFQGVELNEGIAECLTLCHSAIAKPEEFEMSFDHEAVLENNIDCMICHIEPVKGEGEVDQEKCLFCHSEPERFERIGETPFLHATHTSENKVECFQCHRQIRHGEESFL